MIGKQLLNFRILEQIGAGGMGVVFRAFDEKLERPVALKLLHQGALADEPARERFLLEARTASGLNHRNIVTIHQIDQVDGRDFIAMELVDGRTLDEVLEAGPLSLEDALQYALQIGGALDCAHESGIVHRDLKPHNVMLTPRGEIKVLDFGLAKRFDQSKDAHLDEESMDELEGTPAYMSPEQAEGRKVTAYSDIFSFGALFYEILTGISPFKRRSPLGVLNAVLNDDPPPPSQRREDLPEELDRIVLKALAKKPSARYASMGELVNDLQHLWAELFGTGTFEWSLDGGPRLLWRRHGRRLAASAGLVLVAVAGLAFWLGRGSGQGDAPPELTDFRLLSTFPGSHRQATLAPDGDLIAFVSDDEQGTPQLWKVGVEGGEPQQLTDGEVSVERPRYTPDGTAIVFGRRDEGIWRYELETGEIAPLIDKGSWPSLAGDGSLMAYEREKRIWLADGSGGNARSLDSVDPRYFAEWVRLAPAISPDGTQLAYFAPELGPTGNLWVAPVDGGAPRQITDRRFRGGTPTWTPDGRHLIFQADFQGSLNLWSMPADGGEPRPLTRGAGEDGDADLSSDGRHLVYTVSRHIYRLVRQRGEQLEVLHASRLPLASPVLSPDESHIAYFSTVGADYHIFTMEVASGVVTQLTDEPGTLHIVPQWTADGKWIYFYRQRPNRALQRVPATGGEIETLLEPWDWDEHNAAHLSPDGKNLAYTLLEDSQPQKTLVRHLASGEELELQVPVRSPTWSPDGSRLVGYDAADRIHICGFPQATCEPLDHGSLPQWTADGEGIVFARSLAGEAIAAARRREIWLRNPLDSEARRLAVLEGVEPLIFHFSLTAQGSVVWNQDLPGPQELWIADLQ